MYSRELTDYALKSGNRCERYSRRRARRFVLFSLSRLTRRKGRGKENGRLQLYIRRRVTLASTRRVEERRKGNIRYTRIWYVCMAVVSRFPIAHDVRCGAHFSICSFRDSHLFSRTSYASLRISGITR